MANLKSVFGKGNLFRGSAVRRRFYVGQKPVDDVAGGEPFALGLEVGHDAVAQHGRSQRLDIFDGDRIAALQDRARFGAEDQILRSARAGAPFDVILDVLRSVGVFGRERCAKPTA